MKTLRRYAEPLWLGDALHDELERGETVDVLADFSLPVPHQSTGRLFVLTNRYLRCIAFQPSLVRAFARGSRAPEIVFSYAFPFHHITSVGERRQHGVLRPEMRALAFTGPTGPEMWWTPYQEGAELISRLRRRVSPAAAAPFGIADELAQLAGLRRQGALTDDEYERAKAHFLGRAPDQQAAAIHILRQLHGLHVSGVLTASEFNMKKWDVLVRSERAWPPPPAPAVAFAPPVLIPSAGPRPGGAAARSRG